MLASAASAYAIIAPNPLREGPPKKNVAHHTQRHTHTYSSNTTPSPSSIFEVLG